MGLNSRVIIRLLVFAALATALGWALVNRESIEFSRIEAVLAEVGAWGPILFIVLFAAATVMFLPGTVFALAGGALFGPVWGTLLNLSGATIGAVLAFLATRLLGGEWVRARAGERLERLIAGVEAEGWRFVAFVRLVPLFPFNLVNYAFGLTRIGLTAYAATTFVCMIPGAIAFTYAGHAGRGIAAGGGDVVQKVVLAASLLVAVAFLPRLVARFRSKAP